jgi:hypothetical protein
MNKYALAFLFMLVGMIALFAINNWTTQGAYGFISCTFNTHCCDCDTWDGVCTQEITDLCCSPVRVCEGFTTTNPSECYDRYCWDDGYDCIPGEPVDGVYPCKCYYYEGAV